MKNKFWKVINIAGAFLLIELLIATILKVWGIDIPFKVIIFSSYIWIPIALLVWKNKI